MRRTLVAIALVLAATGAGIATAGVVVPVRETLEPEPEHLLPGPGEPIAGAEVADPGGGPAWAVRTYVSRTGLLCVERGRTHAGVFGDVGSDGEFEPRGSGPTGTCGDSAADPVIAAVDRIAKPPTTVIYGASLRRPQSAVLSADGEPSAELSLGERGTFIARLDGLREPRSLPLAVTLADGEVVRIDWEGAP